MRMQIGSGNGRPKGCVGKLLASVFLMVFIGFALSFAVIGYGMFQDRGAKDGWVEHTCTVIDSGVRIKKKSNKPYEPWVTYRYIYGGQTYQSSGDSADSYTTSRYSEAQDIALDYPKGGTGVVYVNPKLPSESERAVEKDGIDSIALYIFGGCFLVPFIGLPLAALVGLWMPGKGKRDKDRAVENRRPSQGRGKGWIGALLFGLAFGGFGAVFFFFVTCWPTIQAIQAQGWTQLPCEIEQSELLAFNDSDGDTTYYPNVLYRYEVDGKTYRSNRHDFSVNDERTSMRTARAIRQAHPVGMQTVCYVNPANPGRAALSVRTWQGASWGLIGLLFALIGFGICFAGLFMGGGETENKWRAKRPDGQRSKKNSAASQRDAVASMPTAVKAGPLTLRPRWSRAGMALILTFAALFWNGIVSIFVRQVVLGFINGSPDWCATLFMFPFLIVGIVLIFASLRQFMLIFAPSIIVQLDRRSIPLGGSTQLRWHKKGGRGRLIGVTIKLVGEESATYTRGTDTVTDTSTFFEELLVGSEDEKDAYTTAMDRYSTPKAMQGDAVLTIPHDTMHSFNATKNKIIWKLVVKAKVENWPDPKDEYDITVLPMPIDDGGGA